MGLVVSDDGWRVPDEVWVEMEPLLPARPALEGFDRRQFLLLSNLFGDNIFSTLIYAISA